MKTKVVSYKVIKRKKQVKRMGKAGRHYFRRHLTQGIFETRPKRGGGRHGDLQWQLCPKKFSVMLEIVCNSTNRSESP